jgi:hypothetical protein
MLCCLRARAQNTMRFYWKGQSARALKKLDPTARHVAYKNHKNTLMDSEIFRGRFFGWFFLLPNIFGNQNTRLLRLCRMIEIGKKE